MNKSSLTLLLLLFSWKAFAQEYPLKGVVKDQQSQEPLIGVTIYLEELKQGTVTNSNGEFQLSIQAQKQKVKVSYIGYETKLIDWDPSQKYLSILLKEQSETLEVVEIVDKRSDARLKNPIAGVESVKVEDLDNIPVLFGEKDLVKTLQYLPGVKSGGEGSSGMFIRGGSLDQNLVLLDGATVYNASHLFGFFSVFNSDVLDEVQLYKGTPPAEFGGRLSSVLDIEMKEGNKEEVDGSFSIGLISAKASLEVPVNQKGSVMVSARRTYADAVAHMVSNEYDDYNLNFYDLTFKGTYNLGAKDRIELSAYHGNDLLGFGDAFSINWGNTTSTLKWNHLHSEGLLSSVSAHFNQYEYDAGVDLIEAGQTSQIQDLTFRYELEKFNDFNTIKVGTEVIDHRYTPTEYYESNAEGGSDVTTLERKALESAIYYSHTLFLNQKLSLNYGLRFSHYNVRGEATLFDFNEFGEPIDERYYGSGESIEHYVGWEPRASLNYKWNNNALKGGYSRNYQYVHMINFSNGGTPMDIWFPSTDDIKPQYADQFSLGYFKGIKDYEYEFSVETYYKKMHNSVQFIDGADVMNNPYFESQLTFGEGRAYGLEFLFKKNKGRFTGWVSYTLSKTEEKYDDINEGAYFPAFHDRTHDITLIGMYQLNRKWSLSWAWSYLTGNAVTYPTGGYYVGDQFYPSYGDRNSARMPDSHRLDVGANWQLKKTEKLASYINFSVYNAYGQLNPYSISFQQSEENPNLTEAVQTSLFSIIPSVSYNIKF